MNHLIKSSPTLLCERRGPLEILFMKWGKKVILFLPLSQRGIEGDFLF